jgi:GrpB-like predicted nucleotidyltransferase (UPF0157 family)
VRVIEVVDHQQDWASRFEWLRASYADALDAEGARYRTIEHVGSTAVPGLAAKPVIDVDIVVDAVDVHAAVAALATIGFESRGDLGVPGRIAFFTPDGFAPSNTYVTTDGSLALRNHLAVRDVLRADQALRDEYGEVKRRAASAAHDIGEYTVLKSEILDRILRQAGLTEAERAEIAEVNRSIAARTSSSSGRG